MVALAADAPEALQLTNEEAYKLLQTKPADRGPRDLTALAAFLRSGATCLNILSADSTKILARHLRYAHFEPGSFVLLQGQVATSL
eukprot:scaffold253630_cov25-Prasinocladus_malaysianus.AAC.1